jgi:hypothetical protein
MSLAALMGIDKERYDQGNKFLSQDPYLQNFQGRAPITFNESPIINQGIMGPGRYPYPIIPQGDGGDGGGINPFGGIGKGVTADATAAGGYNLNPDETAFNSPEVEEELAAARNKSRLSQVAQLGLFALNPVSYLMGKAGKAAFGFAKDKFFGGNDGDGGGFDQDQYDAGKASAAAQEAANRDYARSGGDSGSTASAASTAGADTSRSDDSWSSSPFEYGGRVGFDDGLLADVTTTAEYKGWKKMYEMNPDIGKMHEKHNSFLKAYNTEQKAGGGIVGLFR